MSEVREDVRKAVDFLYRKCGVIDSKLLPYSYHLIILADFFRMVSSPTELQLDELRKWFFYTVYTNYFTNTSLSRIREGINRFRQFASGNKVSPLDVYDSVTLTSFPEKFSLRSVRVCSLVAVTLLEIGAERNFSSTFETVTVPL